MKPRSVDRKQLSWLIVVAAVVVLAVAVVVPKVVLDAQLESGTRWTSALADKDVDYPGIESWVVGDRIYVASEQVPMRSYERATGRVIATYPTARSNRGAVTADGSVIGWVTADPEDNVKPSVTLYAPDGHVRWTKPFAGIAMSTSLESWTPVVAAAAGLVVLADCRDPHGEPYGACTWTGIDEAGKTVWSQQDDGSARGGVSNTLLFNRTRPLLPSVFLGIHTTKGGDEYVVRSAADGREQLRHPHQILGSSGTVGDLVVFAEDSGGCRLLGYRGGKQAFSTQGMPCLTEDGRDWAGRLRIIGDRAYLDDIAGNGRTVSLTDGSWRVVTGVSSSGADDAPTAVGADVIVQHDGRKITATDAGSGEVLWTRKFAGKVLGVVVDNGGVLVQSEPASHNPFLFKQDEYSRLTTLDSRTGRITGRLLTHGGNPVRCRSIAPGQSIVIPFDLRSVSLLGAF
ncbi:outer membrane protein assembly factor BamB family protein [Kribbella sp. NPDC055071]